MLLPVYKLSVSLYLHLEYVKLSVVSPHFARVYVVTCAHTRRVSHRRTWGNGDVRERRGDIRFVLGGDRTPSCFACPFFLLPQRACMIQLLHVISACLPAMVMELCVYIIRSFTNFLSNLYCAILHCCLLILYCSKRLSDPDRRGLERGHVRRYPGLWRGEEFGDPVQLLLHHPLHLWQLHPP